MDGVPVATAEECAAAAAVVQASVRRTSQRTKPHWRALWAHNDAVSWAA